MRPEPVTVIVLVMRIGFSFPQWTGAYGLMGYFARRNSTWPPLNLALLAACCERAGHSAFIVDGQCEGLTPQMMVARLLNGRPDVVGFTATSPFFGVQLEVARLLKEQAPHVKVIMGGPHVTIVRGESDEGAVDHWFMGESEKTLPEFLGRLASGLPSPRVIRGAREGDFDDLPMPSRHLLPMHRYKLGTLNGRDTFTSIQAVRGCPESCTFCASDALDTRKIFRRSAQSVVSEMRHVVEMYGIRHFYVVDDVLTLKRKFTVELCGLLIDSGLSITFEGSTRANLLDEELVILLKKAGLIRLSFGLESANDHVRTLMKKRVPLQAYVDSNRLLNKHGIEVLNSTMIGLPGDTPETVRETIDWVAKSRDIMQANLAIAVPYPGTEFHAMAVAGEHGLKLHTDDFSKYRRYGSAVTTVGGMTPRDLVELQNEGFVRIYSMPWRWPSVYGKHGILGLLLTFVRLARMLSWKVVRQFVTPLDGIAEGHMGSPKAPNG